MRTIATLPRWRRSILGLAVVLALLALFTSLAVSTVHEAALRTKQKRTLVAMRSLGAAVDDYALDHGRYPRIPPPPAAVDIGLRAGPWSRSEPRPVGDLRSVLEPGYIKILPTTDGWGSAIYYDSDGKHYAVIAPAKGGTFESWTWPRSGPGTSWREDFLFSDGSFVKW